MKNIKNKKYFNIIHKKTANFLYFIIKLKEKKIFYNKFSKYFI